MKERLRPRPEGEGGRAWRNGAVNTSSCGMTRLVPTHARSSMRQCSRRAAPSGALNKGAGMP